jgi:broad specificity phosphatase PhoE
MGTLYLVRHGQASFGADNYDQLSDLGLRQSERLGQYFRHKGIRFEAVLHGTLARQVQTWEGIATGSGQALQASMWPGLNEYDSAAVIRAVQPEPLPKPETAEAVRQHFRLLRTGLLRWAQGTAQPEGMPSHAEFVAGVNAALDHVRTHCSGNVLLVSSGGPIATAVAQVLEAPAQAAIEMNLRIRNTGVSELAFSPSRHTLVSFNSVPHLEDGAYADWVSYT